MIYSNIILGFGSAARQLSSYRNSHSGTGSEEGNFYGPLFFFIVTGILALIGILKMRGSKSWKKGHIPKRFEATEKNIIRVYVSAACALSLHDREGLRTKFKLINVYLLEHFPGDYFNVSGIFQFSLQHPLKTDSLVAWCNEEFITRDKINLLNFLAEIAINDGYVTDAEKHHLNELRKKLGVSIEQLNERLRVCFDERNQ